VTVKGEAMLGPPSGDVLNPVATLLSLSGGKGAGTGHTTRSISERRATALIPGQTRGVGARVPQQP